MIASQLHLLKQSTKEASQVVTACTLLKRFLFNYQGHVSAALVLGGCDINGPHIYHIYPHGSTGKLPYATMGSGSLAAMSVFECDWKEDMDEKSAIDLVERGILAGIFNDLGSGSSVDTCVIRMDGTKTITRGSIKPNDVTPIREKITRSRKLDMPIGTTAVLKTTEVKWNRDGPFGEKAQGGGDVVMGEA